MTRPEIKQVDVIGSGISGLAAAYYLARSSDSVHIRVWEKDERPGGLAGSFSTEGFTVEKFYHHLFRRDRALQELIAELGLAGDLVWRPASTGAYYFRRPYRLSSPVDLLRFKPLALPDRLRLGWLALHARTVKSWEHLDDVSARDYILRVAGSRVYEVVWEPLLRGKFGAAAESVSAAWLWRKLVDRGGSRDSKGQETLGYLRGGLGRVFEAMVSNLTAAGHSVNFGTSVVGLRAEGDRIRSIVTDQGAFDTDLVVGAAQTPQLADLMPEELADFSRDLRRIRFLANVCLVMTLKQPLSDFYWTNVTNPTAPFVGIIEQTRWADERDFSGSHLVYVSAYVAPDDPRLGMESEDLLKTYTPYIQELFPEFDIAGVDRSWAWTAPYAQPIVEVGYRHLIPKIQTPFDNLLVCTMAQIYPSDRQVSNGVELARDTVDLIKDKMQGTGR